MRNQKDKRIGETKLMTNGLNAKIINYKNVHDIDIEFADGTIVRHRDYCSFVKGGIRHPNYDTRQVKNKNSRIGEIGLSKNDEKIKIIEYFNRKNITVEFEDGLVLKNCSYNLFQAHKIMRPINHSKHVGEINIASNGQKMEIVEYNGYNDIKIKFEDETITHGTYANFKKGYIKNPNFEKSKKEKTKIEKTKSVKIKEKSGEIKPVKVKAVKIYKPTNKELRTGESIKNIDGENMTIVNYHDSRNIDVQFDDGTILYHKKYSSFKAGKIVKSNLLPLETLVGQTIKANNGHDFTIIEAKGYSKLTIQFDDGTIVKNRRYNNIFSGSVANPSLRKPKLERKTQTKPSIPLRILRIGETNLANNGQMMEIIKYISATDIDVKFEDGTIVEHRTYNGFKLGTIANPNFRSLVSTSINEITMLYYFSKIGFEKKQCNENKIYGKYEYDAFNKDLMLAIEYDGDPRTHTKEKDKRKNDDAEKHNVTIWRIRTSDVPFFKDKRNKIFNLKNTWLFGTTFENVLKNVLAEINKTYNKNYILDIDLKRDKEDILNFLKTSYYKKTNERVGESITAGNGQVMTIVNYLAFGDITVQFEDGTIVEHVRYGDFKLGNIANPKFSTRAHLHAQERINESRIANNGHTMTIIAYRNCHDIDIKFDNGKIVKHAGYNNFTRGKIGLPKQ